MSTYPDALINTTSQDLKEFLLSNLLSLPKQVKRYLFDGHKILELAHRSRFYPELISKEFVFSDFTLDSCAVTQSPNCLAGLAAKQLKAHTLSTAYRGDEMVMGSMYNNLNEIGQLDTALTLMANLRQDQLEALIYRRYCDKKDLRTGETCVEFFSANSQVNCKCAGRESTCNVECDKNSLEHDLFAGRPAMLRPNNWAFLSPIEDWIKAGNIPTSLIRSVLLNK